jgi:hypothetical protein
MNVTPPRSIFAIAGDERLWICVSDALLSGHPMAHVAARSVVWGRGKRFSRYAVVKRKNDQCKTLNSRDILL